MPLSFFDEFWVPCSVEVGVTILAAEALLAFALHHTSSCIIQSHIWCQADALQCTAALEGSQSGQSLLRASL